MGIRFERKAVLFKIESSYGVDPTPTQSANAVLLRNVDIDVAQGERIPRDVIRTGMGQMAQFLVGRHVTMTFAVDLAGAGAAGSAPPYGPMLRACGAAETLVASTRADYTPVDSGFESGAMYINIEGNRHVVLGARGNAKLMLPRNKLPQIQFSMSGIWALDAATAYPTQTLTAWKDPVPVTKGNVPVFTLDGYSAVASNFELDFGMSVAYRELINLEEINVQDRLPTFSAQIEEPALSTKNFFTMMGGSVIALGLQLNASPGNIASVSSGNLQVLDVKRAEDQKVAMLNITGTILKGSPDFTLSIL